MRRHRIVALFIALSTIGLTLPRYGAAVQMVPATFSGIAKAAKPSVVNIFSTRVVRVQGTGDPNEDFFRQFFGQGLPQRSQRQQSLGSGFIVSEDGYIVTNAHVVAQADQIRVKLSNREEYDAQLIGSDQKTDVALIKIKPKANLQPVKLGDSEALEVGDWVVAIGNPFGLAATVTAGIVSAKDRVIGAGPYDEFIQTDASINPGNSGGPLFNLDGSVVGINSAIYSRSGGSVGIGFAIPINLARQIIDELRTKGRVARGWLGITIQEMNSEIAKSFGLDTPRGALVAEVEPGSPAAKASLQRGDIILQFNEITIEDGHQLPARIAETGVGRSVELTLLHEGSQRHVSVTIEEQPGSNPKRNPPNGGSWGLTLMDLTPEVMRRFGIPRGVRGAAVREVHQGGPAEAAGLQPGDVIRQVNRQDVTTARGAQQLFDRSGDKVMLLLQRGAQFGYQIIDRGTSGDGTEEELP
jgi:serine protease Do